MDGQEQVLRRPGGFTLLEAVVATTLTGAIMLVGYHVLAGQADLQTMALQDTSLETRLRDELGGLVMELEECRPIRVASNGESLEYVVPRKLTTQGMRPHLDGDGNFEFGIMDGDEFVNYATNANAVFQLEFRYADFNEKSIGADLDGDAKVNAVLPKLYEAQLKKDLDGNGDQTGVFRIGSFYRKRKDGGGKERLMGTYLLPDGWTPFGVAFSTKASPAPATPTSLITLVCEPVTPDGNNTRVYDDPATDGFTDDNSNERWDATLLFQLIRVELSGWKTRVFRTKLLLRNTP